MIQSILHKAVAVVLPLVVAIGAWGQGVRVTATVDKNRILIGEQITLTLTADIPENEAISFFNIDSIPHFEFINKPPADTSNTNSGTTIIQEMVITSFDSGQFVIPRFELAPGVATDSLVIDVGYSAFDPKQPYHDIKDVLDIEIPKKKIPWWQSPIFIAAVGLVVLAVLIWLWFKLRKKQKLAPVKTEPPTNPYEDALKQIDQLQKSKPAAKEYYSAMVDVFRQYVLRRKNIHSLQKTTDDLVVQLKEIGLDKNHFDQLAQSLRLSDYVKFAKFIPTDSDDTSFHQTIRESIMTIEKTGSPISIKGGKA
jgi:hypothetical protein